MPHRPKNTSLEVGILANELKCLAFYSHAYASYKFSCSISIDKEGGFRGGYRWK